MRKLLRAFPHLDSLHIHCSSNSNVWLLVMHLLVVSHIILQVSMEEGVKELLTSSLETLYFKLFETNSMNIASCTILSQIVTLR